MAAFPSLLNSACAKNFNLYINGKWSKRGERERKRERERVLPSMYQTNTNAAHVNSIIKRYFTYMKLYPVWHMIKIALMFCC